MRKHTWRRLLLGLLQHITVMCILVAVAGIIFNSYLTVESMNGSKTYYISPMDTEPEYEDSEVFREIFQTAVSDITRLVVLKGQLETEGIFDAKKKIDVTQFANRTGKGNDCVITAVYSLEDLIKWGKYGIEYTNRPLSMNEFVDYFGETVIPSNFTIDENGQLSFNGFSMDSRTEVDLQLVEEKMNEFSVEQLEDMVFSYIVTEVSDEISISREDDGTLTVYVPLISCRYDTIDGERQLISYANNWVDYLKLQKNLADTIQSLTNGYVQYQNCNHLYLEAKSNLKYVVRMMNDEGITKTYTNVSELIETEDSAITDYFSEYRRYLIYYPDSLEFTSNTSMTEDEIYQLLGEYEYAYPDTTHIWIGVDTAYPIEGDAFYQANLVFQRIVPYIGYIITLCILLGILWLSINIYLTVTAGAAFDEEGNLVHYLTGIDHIWTEIMLLFWILLFYAAIKGYRYLMVIADTVYSNQSVIAGSDYSEIYQYGFFAAYGFLLSLFFSTLWYSFVRRIKCRNLWKQSFLHWLIDNFRRGIRFVFSHRNTAVSTLIPYNLFLLINLVGVLLAVRWNDRSVLSFLLLIFVALTDSIVGIMIFRNRAEQITIVDGIQRIRDGEVDYKLDADALHGDNKEMADAVNNIGEGIRKAVNTSMKDEQMKTDLITNVSHDIKTPLTSIINYVDLLKRLKIKDEPAKSYIEVLDNKTQRLKLLTDDLVEASKISSGNIELNFEKLNPAELVNQTIGEFVDKFAEKNLHVICEETSKQVYIYADSRRMWRVMENLFNNVYKYALESTRVYVDLYEEDAYLNLSIKNISERPMNIHADELTERFIRGDASRTTEGSGLGLYIAQNLTQAQKGEFNIYVDGDLFKVVLRFQVYSE